ncbi:MAG: homoserine acetyltransferase, partial [Hyphomicrobiales bacterium]|nr:homoserine acetyltransferase [Hyphomicrobiales bacterium]
MGTPQETGEFKLGDFPAEKGGVIADAKLVWQSHGTLSPARDNLILYPSSYSAQHQDMNWLIGEDKILDPTRWFIVIANMFSNGLSSGAAETPNYPALVTLADNVRAQHR